MMLLRKRGKANAPLEEDLPALRGIEQEKKSHLGLRSLVYIDKDVGKGIGTAAWRERKEISFLGVESTEKVCCNLGIFAY